MDYWEKVPGIDESELQNLEGDINSAISSLKDIKKQAQQNHPATAKKALRNLMTSIKFIKKALSEMPSLLDSMKGK